MNISIEKRDDGYVFVYADHPGWSRPASPDEVALWARIVELENTTELRDQIDSLMAQVSSLSAENARLRASVQQEAPRMGAGIPPDAAASMPAHDREPPHCPSCSCGVMEVPIKVMLEKINEMAEDMYLSSVTTFDEDQRLQAVFDEIAKRHGIEFEEASHE